MPAWLSALLTRRMLICIFTGFSSGLPLYLLLNLLPAWLRSEGVDLKTIGFFALIQFPYTWKFVWAPLLDRFNLPGFGRRRGWMLITQIGLLFTIGALGGLSPKDNIWPILWLATLLSLLSATQDIAVDAFRREILSDHELGLGNAVHVNAYRIAGLIPGSLSLILADRLPWDQVFWITGAFMLPGMAMAWLVSEPKVTGQPKTLRQAITEPFQEFIGRQGWRGAAMILGFIFLYKLGDSLCTALATPFYIDMGFTKTDIGLIAKHAGLWPAVIGALFGGLWMVRLGINRALWLFGVVQLVSIFGFAWLSAQGHYDSIGASERIALAFVIGLEAFGVGLGTAAFVAFIARTTHPAYTATQMALFTSLAAVPRTFINASAGWLVENLGWLNFFWLCAVLAIPGMLLLLRVAPWNTRAEDVTHHPA
ncbi:AmpG family muropeptide MFS transporter [Dechloromonas sp. TW-R-39-2]|uniref:AmpG family muropeptide MFS transporter n=1 Tax=Dechloromonas sp. TW-R-39-2 TaxID=2654218 RepID=UPI00193DD871|nr:AmpG family muropeptide MFS transporter [Dechloromonas sp. TW-R-39-2]QRM18322.1 AmpG family muropeptide MFS transporter [Dechloromonas sp. TW-R-39-2]